MIKMRLEGLPEEVKEAIQKLKNKDIKIFTESREYKNRGNEYVRVYLDIDIEV